LSFKLFCSLLCTVFLLPVSAFSNEQNSIDTTTLYIGKFSSHQLTPWKEKSFHGNTNYSIITDSALSPPTQVLKAISKASASGLFFKKRIDIQKTPWLHWSWKTTKLFSHMDETQKSGDDFVARLYIIIDGGLFFWDTHALNYVWSSSHPQGETWHNPYTSNATMFAIESGNKHLGQWQYYTRNVYEDVKKLTGKDVKYIDAIAIMTDSDNTSQQATTYYGDIYLTAQNKKGSLMAPFKK